MTAAHSFAITSRDIDILSFVFAVGGCTIEHLLRRFFPTYRPGRYGPTSSAYHRVRRLLAAGYLSTQPLPLASGTGSSKRFLSIGPASYALLSERLGIERGELHRARHSLTLYPAQHHLAIVDFLVSLELATQGSRGVRLEEWTSERELRRSPFRVKDPLTAQTLVLIPDGSFTLRLSNGTSQSFHLEMDMGTVSPKRLRAKLRAYLMRSLTDPQPILWVVPDVVRQRAIATWALQEAQALEADPTIFWLAPAGQLSETTILTPVFEIPGVAEPVSLVPAHLVEARAQPVAPISPAYGTLATFNT